MEKLNNEIKKAAKIIKNGGIVLFPTETVSGIGANALDEEAVKNLSSENNSIITLYAVWIDKAPYVAFVNSRFTYDH